jgi:hypothetical protein
VPVKKILYLVDTVPYIKENCFQRQLYAAMNYSYDVTLLPVLPDYRWPLRKFGVKLDKFDKVISVLRLRTLHRLWPILKDWLADTPLTIYEQDPWESYLDDAPTKGVYRKLKQELNISKVYLTAPWWVDHVAKTDGLPTDLVIMGAEPRWCDPGPDFDDRPIQIGFRGALHKHRKIVFDQLEKCGLNVEVGRERLDYPGYMDYMHKLKFFAHDESALPWVCDGVPIPRSTGMWIKSIETASRGTFCLRNYHPEGEAYNLSKLPLIQCYNSPEEAPDVVNKILSLSKSARRDIQVETVERIRKQNDWLNTAHKLVTGT